MPLLVNRLSNLSDKMNLRSTSFSCCSCCCVNLFIDSDPIAIIIIINRKAQKTIFEEHVSSFFQYSFQHVLCRRCAPANNYLCNVCNSDCRFIVSSLGLILPNFCGRYNLMHRHHSLPWFCAGFEARQLVKNFEGTIQNAL